MSIVGWKSTCRVVVVQKWCQTSKKFLLQVSIIINDHEKDIIFRIYNECTCYYVLIIINFAVYSVDRLVNALYLANDLSNGSFSRNFRLPNCLLIFFFSRTFGKISQSSLKINLEADDNEANYTCESKNGALKTPLKTTVKISVSCK